MNPDVLKLVQLSRKAAIGDSILVKKGLSVIAEAWIVNPDTVEPAARKSLENETQVTPVDVVLRTSSKVNCIMPVAEADVEAALTRTDVGPPVIQSRLMTREVPAEDTSVWIGLLGISAPCYGALRAARH